MKKLLLATILLFSLLIIIIGSGCKKTTTPTDIPAVTTQDVMLDVTTTTAQSGGTITSVGSSAISDNGIVYSATNPLPTLANTKVSSPLITTSYTFTTNITSLTANTTYYVRAYATNQFGTAYGAVVKFTTSSNLSSVAGVVTTVAGNGNPGFGDGLGTGAQFNNPGGLAVDAQGNVYISDTFNNRIRKMGTDGTVTTIAGNGTAGYVDGPSGSAEFYAPAGLTLDASGNIYVADFGNNVIRKISADGTTVSTFAGNGYAAFVDGAAAKVAAFNGPSGVAFDSKGSLFVVDQNNNMIRKISKASVSLVAGLLPQGYVNGTVDSVKGVWGYFRHPSAIAIDANDNLYIADRGNSAIREITPAGVITTVAGGPGQTALVGLPSGLCVDKLGNIYITDESGQIIELTAARTLYDLAGGANVSGFADGTGTAAQFNQPQGIGIDANGNIYVADYSNNRIRKVVVTTVNNN